ncbi:MAG: hypothetical protein JXA07_12325 [Spirochaetes bacterium]|nr:hypothetical protein [Spirochaetota bacterium]
MRIVICVLVALSMSMLVSCKDERGQDGGDAIAYSIVYLSSLWQRITPDDVEPGFNVNGVTPGCSDCPSTVDATAGTTIEYDPDYSFFVRRGDPDRILVFFMGGGACWDITNCAYHHTYTEMVYETALFLGAASTGLASGQGFGGILDTSDSGNPFRGWTMIYVPYCTGDLNMGTGDNVYTDYYSPGTYPDDAVTISHRGYVNVRLVLTWMQNNLVPVPAKIFVAGSSAGSYAAVMNFPYIRDIFSAPETKAYVLGDAGAGVSGVNDTPEPFLQTVEGLWGLDLPVPVFGDPPSPLADYHYSYKEIFQAIANYYPTDRFAQYTAKWDRVQVWFYDIQSGDAIEYPDTWGDEYNADPPSDVLTDWNTQLMVSPDIIDIGTANYWYYIAAGGDHTILLRTKFFIEESGGVSFLDWVDDFVNDRAMSNRECSGCDVP